MVKAVGRLGGLEADPTGTDEALGERSEVTKGEQRRRVPMARPVQGSRSRGDFFPGAGSRTRGDGQSMQGAGNSWAGARAAILRQFLRARGNFPFPFVVL